jgi:glycosyltransferase involved in cell wall biosynthesis
VAGAVLHVVQICFHLDPKRREPARILRDWWPLVDAAEMVLHAGVRVSVVLACVRSETVTRNGVDYYFLEPGPGQVTISAGEEFVRRIRELNADVFHVHGLGFASDVQRLALLAPDIPLFLQDHADRVPPFWRRRAYRRGLSLAAGVSFCALEQAAPFLKSGVLPPRTPVYEIPETSSRFTPGDQQLARQLTGVHGDPAILWIGNLDSNKDPLTVLDGISAAIAQLPGLKLWCCFRTAPLLQLVQTRIDADAQLRDRVELLGPIPHERVELLMRAADMFVLGSHREGSGCSIIESLACGLSPVVTAIPSFAALTGDGAVGALWPCDDAAGLCEALLRVASQQRPEVRAAVRAQFDRELSFVAVGTRLAATYQELARPKKNRTTRCGSARG